MDEVICSAMQGAEEQELKKIPYEVGDYLLIGIKVDCINKKLLTEKKHRDLPKKELNENYQELAQKTWREANCSNMIFSTNTGWSSEQRVKDVNGVLVSRVLVDYRTCSK
jgi:hypothetical protein